MIRRLNNIFEELPNDNARALQFFQFCRFASSVLLGVFLVKLGVPLLDIAVIEVLLFTSNLFSFSWSMGLKNGLLSYYNSLELQKAKSLLFNVYVLLQLLSIIFALILFLFQEFWVASLTSYKSLPYLGLISILLALSAPTILTEIILLLKNKPRIIFRYAVIYFTIYILGLFLVIFQYASIETLLHYMILLALARLIYLWYVLRCYAVLKIDWKLQLTFLIFSAPLITHVLLGNGMEFIDGLIVTNFFSEEQFPIFRYGAKELPLATILIGALASAMIPLAVSDMNGTLLNIKKRTRNLMLWIFPVSIVLMLCSPFIFRTIYNDTFMVSAQIFNIYLLILGSRILLPQVILFAKHDNKALVVSSVIELLVNIGLSLYLLKDYGLQGIAFATVIAYLLHKILMIVYVKVKYKIKPSTYIHGFYLFYFNSLLVLSYFFAEFIMSTLM